MAKKPAASTLLKAAELRITDLEKKLKTETDSKDLWYKRSQKCEGELEQVSALLDVLPGSPGRKTDAEESWQRKDIELMTRFAAYLANRS